MNDNTFSITDKPHHISEFLTEAQFAAYCAILDVARTETKIGGLMSLDTERLSNQLREFLLSLSHFTSLTPVPGDLAVIPILRNVYLVKNVAEGRVSLIATTAGTASVTVDSVIVIEGGAE